MHVVLIFISIFTWSVAYAQSTKVYNFRYEKYMHDNPPIKEYLKITDKEQIYYFVSNSSEDIPLTILNPEVPFLDMNHGTKVQFPNQKGMYRLEGVPSCEGRIIMRTPNGGQKDFVSVRELQGSKGTFRCVNSNGTTEYLFISYINTKDLIVKYASNKNPQWIKLIASDIKKVPNDIVFLDFEDIESFYVHFPNDPNTKYKIVLDEKNYRVFCFNPDGTKQVFQWINKE